MEKKIRIWQQHCATHNGMTKLRFSGKKMWAKGFIISPKFYTDLKVKGHRQNCEYVRFWGTLYSQMRPAKVTGQELQIIKEHLEKFQQTTNRKPCIYLTAKQTDPIYSMTREIKYYLTVVCPDTTLKREERICKAETARWTKGYYKEQTTFNGETRTEPRAKFNIVHKKEPIYMTRKKKYSAM